VMGMASVLLGGLHAGAHLNLRARFSAERCLSDIQSLEITVLQGATAMFAKLVEEAGHHGETPLTKLRFIGAGGAPIDPTVKSRTEALFGIPLQNGYGLTEAASTCWTRFGEENPDDSIGRPLPGVELKLLDDQGAPVVPGEAGELWVRGPHVMKGYFRSAELTSKLLTPDGWFNTQDLARIAADGRVFVVGRKKDVIIRSGFKVNPLEVESILNRHPAIAHSAVIGRSVEGNEEVVAFVELVQSVKDLPSDFEAYLRQSLSPYKHPSEILVLPSLPLAPNGKVLKTKLLQCARGASR
jgi:acyl-CoA synthetase (AMP-forming)/AMP-acid ligase II